MKFKKNLIAGSYTIFPHTFRDKRGIFTRNFCKKKYKSKKIIFNIKQTNTSFNKHKGTLRGFHFQTNTKYDDKIISCITGSICNVTIDLRKNSKTYLKYYSQILTPNNKKFLIIPEGFAHGFQTLEDSTEIIYFVTQRFSLDHDDGINPFDPYLKISWPLECTILSEKDNKRKFIKDRNFFGIKIS